ncbi:MAG: hypothetical protein V4443_07470 [Pseudomonadota bacterium]
MDTISDHILLTEQEAATILQPHMRNKSAQHWLENDRKHDPVVPFHNLQGQPYYLESDLIAFITHALNPTARFVRISNQLITDNRNKTERRTRTERRVSGEIMLSDLVERRASQIDRRSGRDNDRRS